MLNVERDSSTLRFQVSHRRAHPPGSLHDGLVSFSLRLFGNDRAELLNLSEPGTPPVVMSRSDY